VRIDRAALLVLGLSVFAWAPLLSDTYFSKAHDAAHALIFVSSFDQSLRDGAFLPRWSPDLALGYGYPLFVVYNPLSAALAEVFNLAGLGLVGAVKAVYLLSLAGSGLAMYLCARSIFGRAAGVLSGLVYIYLPYHLADVYVRGAAAEALSFAFPPLVVWATYRLAYPLAHRLWYVLLGALAYAALVFCHNGATIIFTAFLLPWCALLLARSWARAGGNSRARLPVTAPLAAGLVGMAALASALSAAYWLPLAAELRYVLADQWTAYPFADHFVYPFQFLSPFWGYGFSAPGPRDEMSFQVGAVAVLLGVFAARRLRGGPGRAEVAFLLAAAAVYLFAMTEASKPLWAALPLGGVLQFPWRLLGGLALVVALLAGAAVGGLADRLGPARERLSARPVLLTPLLLLGAVASQTYAIPQSTPITAEEVAPRAAVDFETAWADRTAGTVWVAEIPRTSPLVAEYQNDLPLRKAVAADPEAVVETVHHGGSSDVARVRSPRPTWLTFLTYDFPGWATYVDGRPVPHARAGPQALIAVDLPAGEHVVAARFEHTPARTAGEGLSALTFLGVVAGLARLSVDRRRSATHERHTSGDIGAAIGADGDA
jgi:hypothetical protein